MRAYLCLLILTLLCGLASAVDDPRTAARALHRQALAANDLWTALQLEQWGQSQRLRLPTGLQVIGDISFAFPARVIGHHDRSDRSLIVAGQWLHQLAPDGRPLSLMTQLPFLPQRTIFDPTGRWLGLWRLDAENGRLDVAVFDCEREALVWRARPQVPTTTRMLWHEAAVAPDGSALAFGMHLHADLDTTAVWSVSARHVHLLPDARRALAVGPQAAWTLSHNDSEGRWQLYRGTTPVKAVPNPWSGFVNLPGQAYQIDGNEHRRISAAGAVSSWDLPWPHGGYPTLRREGDWVVVDLGEVEGGAGPAQDAVVDFLADEAPPTPATSLTQLTRYVHLRDWLAGPAAEAGHELRGPVIAFHGAGAGLLHAEGQQLHHIDLDGPQPHSREWWQGDSEITQLAACGHYLQVSLADATHIVLDSEATELWRGSEPPAWAGPRHVFLGAGTAPSPLALLHPDPAQRQQLALPQQVQDMRRNEFRIDWLGRRIVAADPARWFSLDPFTATIQDQHRMAQVELRDPPAVASSRAQRGRLWRGHWSWARLLPRTWPNWAEARIIRPLAAQPLGRGNTLVLDQEFGLLAVPTRGPIRALGEIPGATAFQSLPDGSVGLMDRQRILVAVLGRDGQLRQRGGEIGQAVRQGHADPWQIRHWPQWSMTIPGRSLPFTWPSELQFTPASFSSAGREHLYAHCGSVILVLDPAAAGRLLVPVER